MSAGERVLVVSPHPDDDALGCAGLIMEALAQQAAVRVVYVTDGRASHPGHPQLTPAALAVQRADEARAAMTQLGLSPAQLAFLGVADGTLAHLAPAEADRLTAMIAAELAHFRAETIAVPCRADGSSEHEPVFHFVQRAAISARPNSRLIEYPIWAWWNPMRLRGPLQNSRRIWRVDLGVRRVAKQQALAHHRSQVLPTPPWPEPLLSAEFVTAFLSGTEYFFET